LRVVNTGHFVRKQEIVKREPANRFPLRIYWNTRELFRNNLQFGMLACTSLNSDIIEDRRIPVFIFYPGGG
jgi:hypothetical protein